MLANCHMCGIMLVFRAVFNMFVRNASPRGSMCFRCVETIDVCIWRMFVFMSVVVTVWGFVGMFVVLRPLLK